MLCLLQCTTLAPSNKLDTQRRRVPLACCLGDDNAPRQWDTSQSETVSALCCRPVVESLGVGGTGACIEAIGGVASGGGVPCSIGLGLSLLDGESSISCSVVGGPPLPQALSMTVESGAVVGSSVGLGAGRR